MEKAREQPWILCVVEPLADDRAGPVPTRKTGVCPIDAEQKSVRPIRGREMRHCIRNDLSRGFNGFLGSAKDIVRLAISQRWLRKPVQRAPRLIFHGHLDASPLDWLIGRWAPMLKVDHGVRFERRRVVRIGMRMSVNVGHVGQQATVGDPVELTEYV